MPTSSTPDRTPPRCTAQTGSLSAAGKETAVRRQIGETDRFTAVAEAEEDNPSPTRIITMMVVTDHGEPELQFPIQAHRRQLASATIATAISAGTHCGISGNQNCTYTPMAVISEMPTAIHINQ